MAEIERVSPDKLHLDLRNPRTPDAEFSNEQEVLEHLIQNYDIDELVLSILGAGWLDFEPFIVLKKDMVVLEGNRRLAALRLIRDEKLRAMLAYSLPTVSVGGPRPMGQDPASKDLSIPVRTVDRRQDAYVFLGFKHINGPYKWKSLAKAKFASEWLDTGVADVETISRMLGDSHNTVLRLINGWRVLKKAEDAGFDPKAISAYELAISHIYTALPRPSVREFLGIKTRPTELIADEDIPSDRLPNLLQLMTWIYGQGPEKKALVNRQNPDLNVLVRVLANEPALAELEATGDLDRAEGRLTPPAERFDVAVREAAKATEDALLLVDGFDGSRLLIDIVNSIGRTALTMRTQMEEKLKGGTTDALKAFTDNAPRTPKH